VITIAMATSCTKPSVENDTTKPTIEIVEPTPNGTFPALTGDCHMEFELSDDVELGGVTVNVTNAVGTNYYTNSLDISGKTYDYHDHLVVTGITAITPFTVKIEVFDKKGNKETKTVSFNLKP
jgi:Domain of unknown function (DUF4625)